MRRLTRRERRAIDQAENVRVHPAADLDAATRRHPSSQAPGGVTAARSVSTGGAPRPGLVRRAKAYLARRYVDKLGPAVVPPLVAGAVTLVAIGVIVGLVLGVVLATSVRHTGEWS